MPKAPRRRPAADREQRRQHIVAVATRLFAEHGVENVTFSSIAQATRLSRPLIYFYFPDLQSLLFEAMLAASHGLHQRFQAAAAPHLDGLDQIMAIGHAYVRFAAEEPALFACLAHNEAKQPPEQFEHPTYRRCLQVFDGIMGTMVMALHKGMRDGTIRPDLGDPVKVAVSLWGLSHGLIQLHATKQTLLEEKLGPACHDLPDFGLDLIRRGLAALKPI